MTTEVSPADAAARYGVDPAAAERLRVVLELANIPTLLPMLVQITGDRRWMEEPYRPQRPRGVANVLGDNDDGQLPLEVQEEIRAAAFAAISKWLVDGRVAIPEPSEELLCELLSMSMVERIPPEYGALMRTILGLRPEDDPPRADEPPRPPDGFRVAVIGAGASGLLMGWQLAQAGIEYTIFEKAPAVGGTWYHNRYPGAGVDTPSHLYSFSFFEYDWPHFFSLQDTLQDYFETLATECGIRPHIRLSTEVVRATFDEESQGWQLTVRSADGSVTTEYADVVTSAVGAFPKPVVPDVAGIDCFEGPVWHTAAWPDDAVVDGRRVAVVGNGASAMQVVPAIADKTEHLVVIQRTPHWVSPFVRFHQPVPDPLRWLMSTVPLYLLWYRLRLNWTFNDRLLPALRRDPERPHPERSVNAKNEAQREFFRSYISAQLGDRQDLLDELTPSYPPFGKRMLLDNGWFRTITRDDVTLNTSGAVELREHSIVTGDGQEYEVDAVVFATGFDVVRFLSSFEMIGRSGLSIREAWDDDDARAYLGSAVPDFPNFFCLYGPNTQAGHGGSLLGKLEWQSQFVVRLLQEMFEHDCGVVECRQDVYDVYNEELQQAHAEHVWTHPGMSTYYRNGRGRVVASIPWRNIDFFHRIRGPWVDDFVFEPRRHAAADAAPK